MTVREQTKFEGYAGYALREIPTEDPELTHTDPGTPMGEYMRRFWQPVCLSESLTDLPHAIRIMGEDLVAYRDKSGQVGVLNRHCSHRGTSLEYGIVAERGIRCCYHGWLFDADGTILETPGEPPNSKLKDSFHHGAYPAFEKGGLVFAYMGPPELKPDFPTYDGYDLWDNRMKGFSIHFPCNWLQVTDNYMDPVHGVFLHSRYNEVHLTTAWDEVPVPQYFEVGDGADVIYASVRRTADDMVWLRCNHAIGPNIGEAGTVWETGQQENYFRRVNMTRWMMPIDDGESVMFGWAHINDRLDPEHNRDESLIGHNQIDFDAQVARANYEQQQRNPGDWEAIVGQRRISVHGLEHPGSSDEGVQLRRRQLRRAVRGEIPGALPKPAGQNSEPAITYTHDTVLRIPKRGDRDDRQLLFDVGTRLTEALLEGDAYGGQERQDFVERRFKDVELEFAG